MVLGKNPNKDKPLFLAPIATLTHEPFRNLVAEFGGVQGYFTEMVSAEALTNAGVYEDYFLRSGPDPTKVHLQLIGYTSTTLIKAVKKLAHSPFSGIDLNLGCGAPHIRRKGGGSAWLEEDRGLCPLIEEIKKILPDKLLSAKIRIPQGHQGERWREFLLSLQQAGLDFITIHPREPKEKFSGILQWHLVESAAELLDIPVIGNGGIHSYEDYCRAQKSSVDALMIGRTAARAPWIFAYFKAKESGKPFPKINLNELGKRFMEAMERGQPQEFWLTRAKRFFHYFSKNLQFGHQLYSRIQNERNYPKLKTKVLDYLEASAEAKHYEERC